MKAAVREKVASASGDVLAEQVARLKQLFPEIVSEGRIDWETLRATLGDALTTSPERFSFTWSGKSEAIQFLQTPTHATLIPCPEESVDFAATGNVFIEGDNLEVLKLRFKPYFGKVKLIYIDPPYNTGQDFVYPDDYADPLMPYLKMTGQMDNEGNLLTSNPETSGRYHSAWLSMLYPRLFLARQLLRDDGFIAVSVDDTEIHHLRLVMNEIFGEENWIATLVWDRNRKNDAKYFSMGHEYMLVYARDEDFLRSAEIILRTTKEGVEDVRTEFIRLRELYKNDWSQIQSELRKYYKRFTEDDPRKPLARFSKVDGERGPYRDDVDISWPGGGGPTYAVPHPMTKKPCKVPSRGWVYPTIERMREQIEKGYVAFGEDETTVPSLRSFLFEKQVEVMRSVHFSYAQKASQEFDKIFAGQRVFDNPKHFEDLLQVAEYLSGPTDLVLDFFAGSCSVAHAVLLLNHSQQSRRRFFCVQLPEPVNMKTTAGQNAAAMGLATIAEIGKERIRRVLKKLAHDSSTDLLRTASNEDLGFKVFKLAAPHIQPWSAGADDREPDKYAGKLALYNDPLVPGWTAENVLWEITLREGFGLCTRFESKKLNNGNTVWLATDPDKDPPQTLIVCLDEKIGVDFSKSIDLAAEQIVVVRDLALDDTAAANLALQCRLKTI